MFLIFDTETTGLPKDYNRPTSDTDNWPRLVQLAWQVRDHHGNCLSHDSIIIKPDGYSIPYNAAKVHGITTEIAHERGIALSVALDRFTEALRDVRCLVGHNVSFDTSIVGAEYFRVQGEDPLATFTELDTKLLSTDYCKLPGGRHGQYKWPTLTELHHKLFGVPFEDAHDAQVDVQATTKCFFELIRIGVVTDKHIPLSEEDIQEFRTKVHSIADLPTTDTLEQMIAVRNDTPASLEPEKSTDESEAPTLTTSDTAEVESFENPSQFVHLHIHTHYSILESPTSIKNLIKRAKQYNLPAVAITDLGNMYGVFQFHRAANKEGLKPIIGCELHVCENHSDKTRKDNGSPMIFLAKNKKGYQNLYQLTSVAHTEGFYYVPRIDKRVLLQHTEGLIVLSGTRRGEIGHTLLEMGEEEALERLKWWKENFGQDFYLQLSRHGFDDEAYVNETFVRWSREYEISPVATHQSYYLEAGNHRTQDMMVCIQKNQYLSTPIGQGRGFRSGLPNETFYLPSPKEMQNKFADIPEAIENTYKLSEQIEAYEISERVVLPEFELPDTFTYENMENDIQSQRENRYLRYITYEGAVAHFGTPLSEETKERLDFELDTIERTGYPGYFLIVADYVEEAKKMGVYVGPGRGSAAGSLVAYCLGITNVDSLKYDLLFERFLNPDRISLPDIDIDFDDQGRDLVIDWVTKKYGKEHVARIIAFNTIKSKSAIRDAARTLQLPLKTANELAKDYPDRISISTMLDLDAPQNLSKEEDEDLISAFDKNRDRVDYLRTIYKKDGAEAETLREAQHLANMPRSLGVHPCGVIITPQPTREMVPLTRSKKTDFLLTQYDNDYVEDAGLLKMDLLGLTTLTDLKNTLNIIYISSKVKIELDDIPLDDAKTYQLFQQGQTEGIFQFESEGMKKYLVQLKPDHFEDIIAMIALYRPGPMEYIPQYIARKHGQEEIIYDLPEMEETLNGTYGVTVFQEQVMLLSQRLANFTKGEADVLRKAMGKKDRKTLDSLREKFFEGCEENQHSLDVVSKIWKDWEAFARYAFNKSHAVAYSIISYQTAYLKTHYPSEYMAALLSSSFDNQKRLTKLMNECKRMEIKILTPDINESYALFTVNAEGHIRFGLSAVKGVGRGAVDSIVEERDANGLFSSVFDLLERTDTGVVNKRCLESMVYAGCFDSLGTHRAQFFHIEPNMQYTFLERMLSFVQRKKDRPKNTQSLFGEAVDNTPSLPTCDHWSEKKLIEHENDVLGFVFYKNETIKPSVLAQYVDAMCVERWVAYEPEIDQIEGEVKEYSETRHTLVGQIGEINFVRNKKEEAIALFTLKGEHEEIKFKTDTKLTESIRKMNLYRGLTVWIKIKRVVFEKKNNRFVQTNVIKMQPVDQFLTHAFNTLSIRVERTQLKSEEKIDAITEIVKQYHGSKHLQIHYYDKEEPQLSLRMTSTTYHPRISTALIQTLLERDVDFELMK